MTIHVTQRHIAHGQAEDCHFCPVALALKDAFADYLSTALGRDASQFLASGWATDGETGWVHGGAYEFLLPSAVRPWVIGFDEGRKVEPFTFEVPAEDIPLSYREMADGRLTT